jgi:hypothetical protein
VVVAYIADKSNSDSVVYGYAFRDHWMWYNGFLMDDGYYVSFIIWKDYNCKGWTSINFNTISNMGLNAGANTFPPATHDLVYQFLSTFDYPNYYNVWGAGVSYI